MGILNDLTNRAMDSGGRRLTRTQENDIFHLIDHRKLPHSEFDWGETGSHLRQNFAIPFLMHNPSGYCFKFDLTRDSKHWATYNPGSDGIEQHKACSSWAQVLLAFDTWLIYLKKEIDAPDLWGQIRDQRKFLDLVTSPETGNSAFSAEEQTRIIVQLRQIKQSLFVTYRPKEELKGLIEEKFAYLEETMSRMGRKDWINIAIGVSTSIATAIAFSPSPASVQAGEIMKFLMTAFYQLFQSAPLLH